MTTTARPPLPEANARRVLSVIRRIAARIDEREAAKQRHPSTGPHAGQRSDEGRDRQVDDGYPGGGAS